MSLGRLFLRSLCPVVTLAALSSCSPERESARTLGEKSSVSFREWCQTWALSCPEGPAANMPTADIAWRVNQWQAAFRQIKGLATSSSRLEFSREDIMSPHLEVMAAVFGLGDFIVSLRTKVEQNGLNALKLEAGGVVRLQFAEAGEWTTDGGIRVHHEAEAFLRFAEDGTVEFHGIALGSAATAELQNLEFVRVSATNILEVSLAGTVVTGAPIAYVMGQIAGDLQLPAPEDLPLDKLFTLVAPLRNWIARNDRWLRLDRPFLQRFSADAPLILDIFPVPDLGAMASALTEGLESVETGWHRSGGDFVKVNVAAGSKPRCRMEGAPIVMEFKPAFGLHNLGGNASASWMELFGVTAKIDIPGPFDPSFDVSRIEITREKIIIKNVPVIGEYGLKLSDFFKTGNDAMKLVCSSR